MSSKKSLVPAAFVSFKRRWGAVVCSQTQQSRNPTEWLTEWAPEPRDIYWDNLALPYVQLTIRRLVIAVAFFFLTFFFMIPIAFVQTLANIEGIEKAVPFLKPLIEVYIFSTLILCSFVIDDVSLKSFISLCVCGQENGKVIHPRFPSGYRIEDISHCPTKHTDANVEVRRFH